jgi:hypothetical protein
MDEVVVAGGRPCWPVVVVVDSGFSGLILSLLVDMNADEQ